MSKPYEAIIVGVMFDEQYDFEDILIHGIAHSKEKAFSILQEEIIRLYEDYNDDDADYKLEYSESRSEYDEPICVIKYRQGYEHLYCMFTKEN